jgi:hypothetical protein
MASNINTNPIDSNYPIPGINNSSQGFRDNFTSIKNNLNTASTEISDLQSKVIVKSPLTGVVLNNDMGNTLISNASVRSFRATTYNLGGALSGVVTINVSLGDVHYGTIAPSSTVELRFSNWAPAGTQSNVQVYLTVVDNTSYVNLNGAGVTIDQTKTYLVNYNAGLVNAPNGVTKLGFRFSTLDCGASISVEPINADYRSNAIVFRTPVNIGLPGDSNGSACYDNTYFYVCTGNYDGVTPIWKRITLVAY